MVEKNFKGEQKRIAEANTWRRNIIDRLKEGVINIPNIPFRANLCLVCGYEWYSRKKGSLPVECPSCKSYRWNTEKKIKETVI